MTFWHFFFKRKIKNEPSGKIESIEPKETLLIKNTNHIHYMNNIYITINKEINLYEL